MHDRIRERRAAKAAQSFPDQASFLLAMDSIEARILQLQDHVVDERLPELAAIVASARLTFAASTSNSEIAAELTRCARAALLYVREAMTLISSELSATLPAGADSQNGELPAQEAESASEPITANTAQDFPPDRTD